MARRRESADYIGRVKKNRTRQPITKDKLNITETGNRLDLRTLTGA